MLDTISLSKVFNAHKERLFNSWLNSREHSAFTGGLAVIDPRVGGKFTAWHDYISGVTMKIEKYTCIIQNWRTTEFSEDDIDSIVELTFETVEEGTKLTLLHSHIPEGQGENYKIGWLDYYFEPMGRYFT